MYLMELYSIEEGNSQSPFCHDFDSPHDIRCVANKLFP